MKFILVSPSDSTTGGVESTHQFGAALKKSGQNCEVFYVGKTEKAQEHFSFYGLHETKKIDDKPENIVIFPEIMTNLISTIDKAKIGIFWLSIDNYLYRKRENLFLDIFNEIRSIIGGRVPFSKMGEYLHLAQSQYAKEFLLEKGLESFLIEDYVNDDYMKKINISYANKQKKIAYNPLKGKKFTRIFTDLYPDFKLVPLINMTREEMIANLQDSMIYLDLGQHPGRDRIPREAALQGCVVITSKFGSARNPYDVMISDFYKTNTDRSSLKKLGRKVDTIFDNFKDHHSSQKKYRDIVLNDKQRVQENVINLLNSLKGK